MSFNDFHEQSENFLPLPLACAAEIATKRLLKRVDEVHGDGGNGGDGIRDSLTGYRVFAKRDVEEVCWHGACSLRKAARELTMHYAIMHSENQGCLTVCWFSNR